jgi:type II pantothenate kinase
MSDARLLAPKEANLVLKATGGGAYLFFDKLEEKLPGVIVQKEDEMDCLITGKNGINKAFMNYNSVQYRFEFLYY